jgi:hypothetical protein
VTLEDHDCAIFVIRDLRKELEVIVNDWTVYRALKRVELSSRVK